MWTFLSIAFMVVVAIVILIVHSIRKLDKHLVSSSVYPAEAIEIIGLETSDLVNKPLRDIKFPKGAIIGAVVRNTDIIIPTGDTVILPGDSVIIFSLTSAIPSVEKTLMVKMEYW